MLVITLVNLELARKKTSRIKVKYAYVEVQVAMPSTNAPAAPSGDKDFFFRACATIPVEMARARR